MTTYFVKNLPCFALSLLTIACGQTGSESNDVNGDDIDQTVSSLCTDAGAADFSQHLKLTTITRTYSSGMVSSTSPAGGYGSAACNGRYVVEAPGPTFKTLVGATLTAAAGGIYTGVPEAACSEIRVSTLFYGFNAATQADSRADRDTSRYSASQSVFCKHIAPLRNDLSGGSLDRDIIGLEVTVAFCRRQWPRLSFRGSVGDRNSRGAARYPKGLQKGRRSPSGVRCDGPLWRHGLR